LTSAVNSSPTVIEGSLTSLPSADFRIEFFASTAADPTGFGEGQRFLGFTEVMTDSSGHVSFSYSPAAPVAGGRFITATATRLDDQGEPIETSEFSNAVQVVGDLPVLKGDVNGDGEVNNLDITAFIRALSVGGSVDDPAQRLAFEALVPGGIFAAADVRMEGLVNNLDITPFIELLAQAGSAAAGPVDNRPVITDVAAGFVLINGTLTTAAQADYLITFFVSDQADSAQGAGRIGLTRSPSPMMRGLGRCCNGTHRA